jgi:hypothetical protein
MESRVVAGTAHVEGHREDTMGTESEQAGAQSPVLMRRIRRGRCAASDTRFRVDLRALRGLLVILTMETQAANG